MRSKMVWYLLKENRINSPEFHVMQYCIYFIQRLYSEDSADSNWSRVRASEDDPRCVR